MAEPEKSPEEIRTILAQLVELQEIDRETIQARRQMAALSPKLRALDTRLAQEEQEVGKVGASTSDPSKERGRLEREVRDLESNVKEHNRRLMEVKTNKEYAAVNQEIETLRQKIDALETRILEMIEDEEAQEKRIEQAHERLERIRAESQEEKRRIEEQIRSKNEKLQRLAAELDRRRDNIPGDLLAIYDRLSQRHPGDVVVPAVRNHCGGCHLNLVSQKMVEIRQMKKFVRCEGCLRLFSGEAES